MFKEKILDGTKTQTVREPRVHPIREGNTLYLWWKSRTKDREFLGQTRAVRVRRMHYHDFWFDDEFARKDGFTDSERLRKFFGRDVTQIIEEEELHDPFEVIEWAYPLAPPAQGDWRLRFYRGTLIGSRSEPKA